MNVNIKELTAEQLGTATEWDHRGLRVIIRNQPIHFCYVKLDKPTIKIDSRESDFRLKNMGAFEDMRSAYEAVEKRIQEICERSGI